MAGRVSSQATLATDDGSALEAARTLTSGLPSAAAVDVAGEEDTESEQEMDVDLRQRGSSAQMGIVMVERRRKRAPMSTVAAGAKRARPSATAEPWTGSLKAGKVVASLSGAKPKGKAEAVLVSRQGGGARGGSAKVGGGGGSTARAGAPGSHSFIAVRSSLRFPCSLCSQEMDTAVGLWMHVMRSHPEMPLSWSSMTQANVYASDQAMGVTPSSSAPPMHPFFKPRVSTAQNGVEVRKATPTQGTAVRTAFQPVSASAAHGIRGPPPGQGKTLSPGQGHVVGTVSKPATPPPPGAARRGRPPGSGASRMSVVRVQKDLFVCVDGVGYAGCGREFTSRSGLWVHVRSVHKGIKHICTVCNKKFPFSSGLSQHIESVHLGMRRTRMGKTCPECGNVLKGSLKKHMASQHPHILMDVMKEGAGMGSDLSSWSDSDGDDDDAAEGPGDEGPERKGPQDKKPKDRGPENKGPEAARDKMPSADAVAVP